MKPNLRSILMLVTALVLAGAIFHQAKEMHRLRAVIAELTSLPSKGAAISTATNPQLADFEELRQEAAELNRLRADVAQLRREKTETSALEARIDKLAADVSAILRNLDRRSESTAFIDGLYRPEPNTSPLVLQASFFA